MHLVRRRRHLRGRCPISSIAVPVSASILSAILIRDACLSAAASRRSSSCRRARSASEFMRSRNTPTARAISPSSSRRLTYGTTTSSRPPASSRMTAVRPPTGRAILRPISNARMMPTPVAMATVSKPKRDAVLTSVSIVAIAVCCECIACVCCSAVAFNTRAAAASRSSDVVRNRSSAATACPSASARWSTGSDIALRKR
jgi:hypothetical protein